MASSKLHNYLVKYAVPKGNAFTHTSLGKPLGSFYVPMDSLTDFMRAYADAIDQGEDVHLTEKHRHVSPVLIDLDLRFQLNSDNVAVRRYSSADMARLVQSFGAEIAAMFDVPDFTMVVMEKSQPSIVQKRLKDGVHIVLPDVVSKPSVQYVLRQRACASLKTFFEELGAVNRIEEIIDEAVIERNNWLLYGSKKPNGEAYKVTSVYKYSCESGTEGRVTDVTEEYAHDSTFDIASLLSIRNKHDETRLRVENYADIEVYERELDTRRRKMETAKAIIADDRNDERNEYFNLDEISQLVDILASQRAESYDDWIRLGWCLRNIDHRLVDKWDAFSKTSRKYKEGECHNLWNHMKSGGGLGVGTLHMWAKADAPDKYAEMMRRDLRKLIYESKSATHNDVARVIHYLYQYEYVCSSIKNRFWYEFKHHRWHPSDSAFSLRVKMSNDVWKEYMAAARDLSHRATETSDSEQQDRYQDYAKKMIDIAHKLKTTSFKENVLKECAEMFYVEKFEEKLDSNLNLIGFENGVYDLDMLEFRAGRPEDYISFSTGNNYIAWDPTHPYIHDIKHYLSQVLPKAQVREYVMKLFAMFLHGAVKEQKFYIWTGSGSNSKSKCVELFEKAFGDYCCKFPITMLTMKRAASNAATSELARAKGKRFACLQEPSEDEKLNCGYMKELSGGDKIMARSLFKEPIEFVPQFKMVLLCNALPHVPSDDGGTWRRIRLTEFTSKFVDNPVEENEYPIDYDLTDKMLHWREHFMALLLEYYKLYKTEGITEPEEVLTCTREYKRNNDHLADFIHNCIERKQEMCFLPLNEAFQELKTWAKDDNIPIKVPTKGELEKYLSKTLNCKCVVGSNNSKGFKGYALKRVEPAPGEYAFAGGAAGGSGGAGGQDNID